MTDEELSLCEFESRSMRMALAEGIGPFDTLGTYKRAAGHIEKLLVEVKRLRAQWDESPRWEVRVKELERRADVARLALAGGSP